MCLITGYGQSFKGQVLAWFGVVAASGGGLSVVSFFLALCLSLSKYPVSSNTGVFLAVSEEHFSTRCFCDYSVCDIKKAVLAIGVALLVLAECGWFDGLLDSPLLHGFG